MLFSSYPFLFLFLPATLAGLLLIGRRRSMAAVAWLATASLVFYACWNPRYVPLLVGSIVVNFLFGRTIARSVAMHRERSAALLLAVGVAFNLLLLGFFKYFGFLVSSLDAAVGLSIPVPEIILPLGISFFSFTQIAFLVDARRGYAREYDFLNYVLFVTYFPHLIAGPIIHHREMMPQFVRVSSATLEPAGTALGLSAFAIGLFKKVVVADQFARYAVPVFAVVGERPILFFEAWIGALAYTLQLYFDFSAYSDMAIGLSLLFGVRLPLNFDSPYKSRDITEFWRRWHMTLSRFLRDYVYIPLGGNRLGPRRQLVNLVLTMLVGGLWHGAAWTFVAWGGLHGCYLAIHHWWRERRLAKRLQSSAAWAVVSWFLTFLAVVVGWVFFRADSFAAAWRMLRALFGLEGVKHLPEQLEPYLGRAAGVARTLGFDFRFGAVPNVLEAPLWIAAGLAVVLLLPNVQRLLGAGRVALTSAGATDPPHDRLRWAPTLGWALAVGTLAAVALLSMQVAGEFLYYQF